MHQEPRSVLSRELLPVSIAIFATSATASFQALGIAAALPDIATDLGNVSLLPWAITAFLLTSTLATVAAGPMIDSFGVSRVFRVAVTVFAFTGFGVAFAPTMEILVALRVLQGVGAGLILSTGVAAVSLSYPGHLISRAYAANATVWGVMGVAGPAVAAAILTFLSWEWIFYVNLPMGALALAAGWTVLPDAIEDTKARFDLRGILLLAALTIGTLFAVDALDLISLVWLAAAALAAFGYLWHARRSSHPVVRLEHIAPQPYRGLGLATALLLTGTFAMSTYVPLYVRAGLEGSPALTAWSVLPLTVGWTAGAWISSRLAEKHSESWVIVLGFFVNIPSMAIALVFVLMDVGIYPAFVVFFSSGVGVGMSTNAALTLLRSVAKDNEVGRVSAAHLFARNQGFTFGSAVGGAVLLFVVTILLGDVELVRELIASPEGGGPVGAAEAVQQGFAASVGVGLGLIILGLFSATQMRRALSSARIAKSAPGRR